MDVGLAVAGVMCLVLGIGHTTVGVVWVLPSLTKDRLPTTPFGSGAMTESMVRVTWFIVTVFVLALGGLLLNLATAPGIDARTLMLRWFAGMWLAATAMALFISGRRLRRVRDLMRLPVPMTWVVVAVLCWVAST